MELDRIIGRRHSTRSFKQRAVSWKDVMEAVDSAIKGPFAGNINHLKFMIIENHETIKRVSEFCQQLWISEAPIMVVVCSDDTFLEKQYGERGRIYSRQQSGAAVNTFIMKLIDLGLDSCWVGAYSDELIKQLLKIPEHIQLEAIIPIGHENPSKAKARKRKNSLERSIYWEKWQQGRRLSTFEDSSIMREN